MTELLAKNTNSYEDLCEKMDKYIEENHIEFIATRKFKCETTIEDLIFKKKFKSWSNKLPECYKYKDIEQRKCNKNNNTTNRPVEEACRNYFTDGLDETNSCSYKNKEYAEILVLIDYNKIKSEQFFNFIKQYIPDIEKDWNADSIESFRQLRIHNNFSTHLPNLKNIIDNSSQIIDEFINKLQPYGLVIPTKELNTSIPKQPVIKNGEFWNALVKNCISQNNSNSKEEQKELKVLTGVKDIKEFSEPVQEIISIFKGEDSDKIDKKEVKIKEKPIIEETKNETLINQIIIKQQECESKAQEYISSIKELGQLVHKLMYKSSN